LIACIALIDLSQKLRRGPIFSAMRRKFFGRLTLQKHRYTRWHVLMTLTLTQEIRRSSLRDGLATQVAAVTYDNHTIPPR
jgi:hypothetical protein